MIISERRGSPQDESVRLADLEVFVGAVISHNRTPEIAGRSSRKSGKSFGQTADYRARMRFNRTVKPRMARISRIRSPTKHTKQRENNSNVRAEL